LDITNCGKATTINFDIQGIPRSVFKIL